MASNLSAIGFSFPDSRAFQEAMLRLAADSIERLDCEAGSYSIWRSRTGAEIWFHLSVFGHEDDARDIVGLTPWFEGESEVALEIRERVRRLDDNDFEGALSCRIQGTDHRIVFDAVDFAAHSDRKLPASVSARLVGFAKHVVVSRPDEEIVAAVTRDARLCGRVLDHSELVNEASGGRFRWLLVQCLGARLDIVVEPGAIAGDIADGCHVQVECALFGRVLD